MDISIISGFISPIAVVAALCVGYIVKNAVPADAVNRYIPLIVAAVGVAVTCAVDVPAGTLSVGTVVNGMVSGLASTGLYEAFKQLLASGDAGYIDDEEEAE